jgi:hypothetical protein
MSLRVTLTKAEAVGEEGGSEQDREAVKGDDGPHPGAEVEDGEQGVDGDDLGAGVAGLVVEEGEQRRAHQVTFGSAMVRPWTTAAANCRDVRDCIHCGRSLDGWRRGWCAGALVGRLSRRAWSERNRGVLAVNWLGVRWM